MFVGYLGIFMARGGQNLIVYQDVYTHSLIICFPDKLFCVGCTYISPLFTVYCEIHVHRGFS